MNCVSHPYRDQEGILHPENEVEETAGLIQELFVYDLYVTNHKLEILRLLLPSRKLTLTPEEKIIAYLFLGREKTLASAQEGVLPEIIEKNEIFVPRRIHKSKIEAPILIYAHGEIYANEYQYNTIDSRLLAHLVNEAQSRSNGNGGSKK